MTKFIALAAAALITTATVASADSYFSNQRTLGNSSILDLDTVTSDGAGVVNIYDFRGGVAGALLGSEHVFAGANSDVRINVNRAPRFNVIAQLQVDGQVVAEREYFIAD